MSVLEQSMMDMEMLTSQMRESRFPMTESMLTVPSTTEDDEFFKDLPVTERGEQPKSKQPEAERGAQRAFSAYSFSNSSVVDDQGRRIVSTRRRYEDSTGRLKAVHDREVDGRRLKTIWNRKNKDEQGEHRTVCSDGTPEDFERLWAKTPFALAQEKKNKQLKHKGDESGQSQTQAGEKKADSKMASEIATSAAQPMEP
ncbi:hypothetical protein P43SY_000495 [Pythium insidiosum]|uniref:Uncharacterized protein n=1 Tax=Pythium insidiosum TaxID=114742 RepID=A0AAD5M3F5_PYTIN|nr:hypothetical protein P43SY_000495 [Pythium insidiosum]